ncbi:MAG: hypothetical protein AB8U40_03605 [Anaplasma ovis]
MVPSPGASAASAEGLQQDALHRLTQEIARQLRSTPGTASRRDDIYAQEEDVALAAGSSTDADCVFIRLSPVEWSLLRDNREVAHIREILDGGQAIEAPRLFHCDNKLHVLARDGAIFRIDSASIVPAEYLDSAATLGDAWMLLRPQLPEGQRMVGLAREVDAKCGEVHFPRGMHYVVAHCGTLAGTIKKVMLDRDSTALPESPESRMRLFHQYVALHYGLASELTKAQKSGGVPLETVRRFMSSPAGAEFARDLLDYRAEFQVSVEQDEHILPEHSVFLSDALSVLDALDQEEVLQSDGVSQEVMCMLYSLSGATYLVKSDYDVAPAVMNELTERLTAKFLADANFRGALIDLAVREVVDVILKEQLPNQTAESDQPSVLGLDGVLAQISSRRGMPWMCRAIPGLAQSVATAVLGLCGARDTNNRNVVSPGIVSQLHIIPGFDRVATGARFAEEGTKVSACYEQLCFDTAYNMALRPLIVAAAAAEAVQRSEAGRGKTATREKEDFFALAAEKYRNASGVANAAERATTIMGLMPVLTRDDVEEIVAHTTAAWIGYEFGDLARHYLSAIVRRDVGASEYVARWLRNDALCQESLFSSAFSTEIRDSLFYTRGVDIIAMSEGLQPAFGDLLTPQLSAEDAQTVARRASSSSAETERSLPGRSEGAVGRKALLRRAGSAPALNEGTSDFPAVGGIGDERNVVDDTSSDRVIFFLRPVGNERIRGDDAIAKYVNEVRNSGGANVAPQVFGVDRSFYIVGCDGSLFELVTADILYAGRRANSVAIPDGASWVLARTDCTQTGSDLHITARPRFTLRVQDEYDFPRSLRYSVAHADKLEVVLKKLMFQLNAPNIEPLHLRRVCLLHYIGLQRALVASLPGIGGGEAEERAGVPTEEALRCFMLLNDIGNGFARDLLDYQEELEAISNDELNLPKAERDFLASALTVARSHSTEILSDSPGSVPLETMCGLYALTGGNLLLKDNVVQDIQANRGYSELFCNFLSDPGFRDTLIALTIRGVMATMERVKRERPDLEDPRAFSDEVLRIAYSDTKGSTLPAICRSIPGLVESATAVLAGFYNPQSAEIKVADHGLLAHMHAIPGFGTADLGGTETGRGRQTAHQCEVLREHGAGAEYALPVIVARAVMRGESMESHFSEVYAEYEREEEKISSVTECITQLRQYVPTLEHSTLRELVYNAFATGVGSMFGYNPQSYSQQAFLEIARGAAGRVSALLARRALELPENLCFSQLMGQRLSACIEAGSEVLGVSSDLYPAFRGVLRTPLPGYNDSERQRAASMTPETMHEIAERESARVTRALQNASGVGARLKAGAKVRAHYMQNAYSAENFVADKSISAGLLSTSLPDSLPSLSQAAPIVQDSRSASPVRGDNTPVAEAGSDETGMFFSANFGQPTVEPASAAPVQEGLAEQDSRSASPVRGDNTPVAEAGSDETGMFFSANFGQPTVEPASAAPAQEDPAEQDSRSASPVGGDRTSLSDTDNAGAESPQPVVEAVEPINTAQVRESLTERGFDAVDAVGGPATELQQATAIRVGGRSRRSSLLGESDVLRVSENVAYVGEEALRRHDSVADPRVVLILEEFDVNTLPNTHLVKARMLAAMRQSAGDAAITFYQQHIELPENGCDAHTFCVMNGKSFKVAPDVRVAPPGRSIDALLSEIPSSPTSTKLVIKIPNMTRGLSLSDGKLNFQRAEFDISGFAFPAVREVNCDGLMSLMLNNYIAHARGGNLLGHRTLDVYVDLQRQLFDNFVAYGGGRDYELAAPDQRWPQFVRSPVGSKFVGDVKRYMRSFRNVHDIMPDAAHKTRLHSVMTAISHNIVDVGDAGTSLEVLKALHALSSASYGVDCTNVQAEEQTRAITRKFLADEEFGMVLIMAAMESCLTALAVHFGRSSGSGTPTDNETIHATLNSTVPDICRRIPGLTTGIIGLLQRVLGVNRGSTIGQSGQQSAIVTSVEKWVDGRQEAAEEIFSGFSLNQYLESANASHMRNAIVACAQAKAAQRGDGSNRHRYYGEAVQEFLGDMDNIPSVAECEERIGTAIARLNDDMLAELVVDSVAYKVYKNLVNSHNPALGCEENLVDAFYGYFGNHRHPRDGAVQFARDLSTHSKQVISKFLAAEGEIVREFLPSVMSSHSNVLFVSAAAPCEVSICAPAQTRNAPPHTHDHELTEGERGLGTAQHAR